MANFSNNGNGAINYNPDIVYSIVEIAVQEVDGVQSIMPNKGLRLDFEKDGVYVDVSVTVEYSNRVPDLAFRIQQSIKQAVESMTKYRIVKIDVHVQDVVFPGEKPAEPPAEKQQEQKG